MKVIIQEWLIPKHVPVSTLREVNDKKRSNSSSFFECFVSYPASEHVY